MTIYISLSSFLLFSGRFRFLSIHLIFVEKYCVGEEYGPQKKAKVKREVGKLEAGAPAMAVDMCVI